MRASPAGDFIAIQPQSELARSCSCWPTSTMPRTSTRYRVFEDWFKHTQDIPGAFYLWLVEHLFRRNELVSGELVIVDGRARRPRAITCPLFLLAGATDHITPPAQVFAAADAVGTPAADVTERTAAGGHLGLFMGPEALREHWPVLMAAALEPPLAPVDPARARRSPRRDEAGAAYSAP